jgi:hypothetical protein
MSEKNDQNALWQKQNSHNPKFRVVDFCNSHNAFWLVSICHKAKFALWLLEKTTTTRCGKI